MRKQYEKKKVYYIRKYVGNGNRVGCNGVGGVSTSPAGVKARDS